MRIRFTLIAAGLAVTCCAAAAYGGLAGGESLRAAFDKQELDRNTHDKAIARCPQGTQMVSNGFAAPDRVYAGGGPYTEILGAARRSEREFAVTAENFSSTRGDFYSYAYCGDVGQIRVAEATDRIGPRNSGGATARCPGDLTAISGGWSGDPVTRGRPQLVPATSKRAGTDGWKVVAENGAFKGDVELIVQAYCAEVDPPSAVVNDEPLQDLTLKTSGVSCRGGREAVAGGFDAATKGGFTAGADVFVSRRKKGGVRWKIAVVNGGRDRHLKVYAYCA